MNSFLNKYKIKPIFVAVFTVNKLGGFLDLMATSPKYRLYGIATHMIYVIQDIFHVLLQKMTLTLHCDALVKTTYSNMGFAIYDNFNKSIIQYFGLCSDYKNR